MRNWDLGEFRVQLNLPSMRQQVRVPICGFPNRIRQVVSVIFHTRLYPPHRSHLHPPSLTFSSTTLPSLQNTKTCHLSLSLHVMIINWHQVQHTPSIASKEDCLSSLHSHDYELTAECSFSFWRAPLHQRPPSASSPWELKGKVTLSQSHSCKLTNGWIASQHPVRRPSTAAKY